MFNPTFVGRMTADPVLRTAPITNPTTGEVVQTPVLNFRVAVDDGFRKDAEGKKIDTFQRGDKGAGWGETIESNKGSWSRIPDGTGKFMITPTVTGGAANDATDAKEDELVK